MTLVHTPNGVKFQNWSLVRIKRRWQDWASDLANRLAIKRDLTNLSERALRDIGLTPNDVDTIGQHSLSANVAVELETRALRQSRNW